MSDARRSRRPRHFSPPSPGRSPELNAPRISAGAVFCPGFPTTTPPSPWPLLCSRASPKWQASSRCFAVRGSARLAVKVPRFSAGDAGDAADLQASYAGGMREHQEANRKGDFCRGHAITREKRPFGYERMQKNKDGFISSVSRFYDF